MPQYLQHWIVGIVGVVEIVGIVGIVGIVDLYPHQHWPAFHNSRRTRVVVPLVGTSSCCCCGLGCTWFVAANKPLLVAKSLLEIHIAKGRFQTQGRTRTMYSFDFDKCSCLYLPDHGQDLRQYCTRVGIVPDGLDNSLKVGSQYLSRYCNRVVGTPCWSHCIVPFRRNLAGQPRYMYPVGVDVGAGAGAGVGAVAVAVGAAGAAGAAGVAAGAAGGAGGAGRMGC